MAELSDVEAMGVLRELQSLKELFVYRIDPVVSHIAPLVEKAAAARQILTDVDLKARELENKIAALQTDYENLQGAFSKRQHDLEVAIQAQTAERSEQKKSLEKEIVLLISQREEAQRTFLEVADNKKLVLTNLDTEIKERQANLAKLENGLKAFKLAHGL